MKCHRNAAEKSKGGGLQYGKEESYFKNYGYPIQGFPKEGRL